MMKPNLSDGNVDAWLDTKGISGLARMALEDLRDAREQLRHMQDLRTMTNKEPE